MKISRYNWDDLESSVRLALTGDSFFASDGFVRLWTAVEGRPVAWVAEENERIQAMLPGIEFGRKPLVRFQAMPDGCYGRIYFDRSVPSEEHAKLAGLFSEVLCQAGYVKLFLFDFYKSLAPSIDMETTECSTQLVDISDPDWQPPDKKLQSEIRKAEREGVEINQFDQHDHMERFLELMESTERRHDRVPKYPRGFYEKLAELAAEDKRVVWTWCEHEGNAVSSHINFIESDMLLNWQVYYDKQYSFLKANQLMLYAMAHQAAKSGVRTLNLGASPPDAESLSSYKQKWGASTFEYDCYSKKSFLGRIV